MITGTNLDTQIKHVLYFYSIPTVHSIQEVAGGLITPTYRVQTAQGDFGLQRVHSDIPDAAMEDMWVVGTYLAEHEFLVPRLIKSSDGAFFIQDEEGARWRMYHWAPGTVRDEIPNLAAAHAAGQFLGRLHRALSSLDYHPKGTIPHFHDTSWIFEKFARLRETIRATATENTEEIPAELAALVPPLIDGVMAHLPRLIVGDSERGAKQVIHGDPKSSNLLFGAGNAVAGIIDCDTFLWHYRAIDFGDAFRSWCKVRLPSEPYARFDLDKYRAAAQGYSEVWENRATIVDDHLFFLRAARQITLELVSRFLIDVEENYYFGWNGAHYPSRRAHNIARAQAYFHLFTTIPETL